MSLGRLALGMVLCATGSFASAQETVGAQGVDIALERARIQREQTAVQAHFEAESAACYSRFAVNDCLHQQRVQRREHLDDLRRQQVALNQMDRARRAQEQLARIREKAQTD